ncbi:MAG: glycosyltransferase family 2 protein [Endomicrobium sp.]|nr:glycosyltransferase family 2 protein [Endomicrobium sp.]
MDISVIVTAHKEGELVQKTLVSVFRAIKFAKRTLKVELLIILDKADNETRRYIYSYQNELFCRIYEVDFCDSGLSRNFGVSKANGRYIAIFDADDLMSESWLRLAYKSLESFNKPAVVHVDKCFVFGEKEIFYKQCSSLDKDFDIAKFFLNNYWNVVCMAAKTIFENYKYQSSRIKEFCFHEDWDFYIETLANGIEHIVADGSSVFIRRRLNSKSQTKKKYMVRSSKLFSKDSVKIYNTTSSNLEKFELKSILVDIRAFLRYPSLYIQNRAKAIERLKRYVINELNTKYIRQYVDSNLLKEFVEINKIESFFPVTLFKYKKKAFVLGTSSDIRPFLCYKELITQYYTNTKCLLFLPRFNKEKEEWIRNLSKDGRKYSVFLTRENERYKNHLVGIKNVRFIFLNRILRDINLSDRETVLIRFLEQIKPPSIITIGNNSEEVNCLMCDFSTLLARFSDVRQYRDIS